MAKTLRITSGDNVVVKLEEMPQHTRDRLARATLRAVERFFELPGVKEDYEKWLVEYEKRENKELIHNE